MKQAITSKMHQINTLRKSVLLGLMLCTTSFNSWGAGFAAMVYGEQFVSSDFGHLISQEFISKFPSEKFDVFILVNVSQASSDMAVCSATVGVVPANSFEFPQHTYGAQGFRSIQYGFPSYQRKSIGMECLTIALKKMMADNLAAIYVPAKR